MLSAPAQLKNTGKGEGRSNNNNAKKKRLPPTKEQLLSWQKKINQIQSKNVSPEKRALILKRAQQQQRRYAKRKKAKSLRQNMNTATRSFNTMQVSMNALRSSRMLNTMSNDAYKQQLSLIKERNTTSVKQVQQELRTPTMEVLSASVRESSAKMEGLALVEADDDMEEELAKVEDEEEAKDMNDFEKLLSTLRKEPTEEAEVAVQFEVYEEYLKTVVTAREGLQDLWKNSADEFPVQAQELMKTKITNVDKSSNLEINFESSNWFVHEMLKKAEQNRRMLLRLAKEIETKLELIAREEDCPVCLDKIEKGNKTVLSCCHCVCTDCWVHWNQVMHDRAFCPICRNDEFLSAMLQ
eukprot:g6099.t1